MKFKAALGILLFLIFFLTSVGSTLASSPPITQATLLGTLGNEDWYLTNVNVSLTGIDDLEGVASTTYWLGSDAATTQTFPPGENSILNPSFEECGLRWRWLCLSVASWEKYFEGWGVLMWRSAESHGGAYSAAIGNFWGGEVFWHNRNSATNVVPTQTYSFSVWIKAYVFDPNIEVGGEVWAKKESFAADVKLAQTEVLHHSLDWTQLTLNFTAPADVTSVYVRLRAKAISPLTVVLFDEATLSTAPEAKVSFNVIENGIHTLHFYSTDRAGNQENPKLQDFKIDSIAAQDWQDFSFQPGQKDHAYTGFISVRDVTSGIEPISAEYRFYTDHQAQGWSDWQPVTSIKVVETGLAASKGETRFVQLATPEVDFGDSSTVYRFQFRISDVAGNQSISPIQTIEGPWVQVQNGQVLAHARIDFSVPAPSGKFNSNDLVTAAQTIVNFTTRKNFKVTNYLDENLVGQTLSAIFPNLANLRVNALPLPQNKLPATSGNYYYEGDFVIDAQTLSPSFEKNVIAVLIFIEGNLRIKKSYSLNQNSGVIFLVEGQIEVEGEVQEMAGIFMSEGLFHSSIDGKINRPLKVRGAALSLQNFVLTRDLGKGAQGNTENPAEKFILPPALFLNSNLTSLLEGKEQKVKWLEVK